MSTKVCRMLTWVKGAIVISTCRLLGLRNVHRGRRRHPRRAAGGCDLLACLHHRYHVVNVHRSRRRSNEAGRGMRAVVNETVAAGLPVPVLEDLGPHRLQLGLQRVHLLLQQGDGAHAAVHRIPQPEVRLVHQAARCVRPLPLRHLL